MTRLHPCRSSLGRPHGRSGVLPDLFRAAARGALIAATRRRCRRPGWRSDGETVGSEATRPNTPGWARSTAMSHAASPPNATAIPRSVTNFPGSCTASGLRHRPATGSAARPDRCARGLDQQPDWVSTTPQTVLSRRFRASGPAC